MKRRCLASADASYIEALLPSDETARRADAAVKVL
jgi:hypothetical protein